MNKIVLFNPRSANSKHRIPNSILQIGASIEKDYDYVFVDGNIEKNPWQKINSYFSTGEFRFFGCTVMPGKQLREAILITRRLKNEYPETIIIWGGYFPSNQDSQNHDYHKHNNNEHKQAVHHLPQEILM